MSTARNGDMLKERPSEIVLWAPDRISCCTDIACHGWGSSVTTMCFSSAMITAKTPRLTVHGMVLLEKVSYYKVISCNLWYVWMPQFTHKRGHWSGAVLKKRCVKFFCWICARTHVHADMHTHTLIFTYPEWPAANTTLQGNLNETQITFSAQLSQSHGEVL